MKGGVTKEEYASALRAYQKATDGMKSDAGTKGEMNRSDLILSLLYYSTVSVGGFSYRPDEDI